MTPASKIRLSLLALPALALLMMAPGTGPDQAVMAGEGDAGKDVFLAQKCNMCHAVSSAGIEATVKSEKMLGPDLTGVLDRHDAEWIAKYVRQESDVDGEKHKKKYSGSEEDLKAIMWWLGDQYELI